MPVRRIVTWNIRHGGGRSERQKQILERLRGFAADLLVVTEFRIGAGRAIIEALRADGYDTSYPAAADRENTVLVASRAPILHAGPLQDDLPELRHLWCIETAWLRAVGVYMPLSEAKRPYWEAILAAALRPSTSMPDLFLGDFNTGSNSLDRSGGTPFVGAEYMARVADIGLVDLWRTRFPNEREYTWYSAGGRNGFRLDHAFASAAFAQRVIACRYDHAPRLAGISDHSTMLLDVQDDTGTS